MKYRIKSLYGNKLTFFSGTDTNTLLQEGKDCNNFLSLIVNNAGDYTAAITRKITCGSIVEKKTTEKKDYPLFNTGTIIELPEETKEFGYCETSITVEYFNLTIEKPNNITASPACEAFSRIINKPVQTPAATTYGYWKPSNYTEAKKPAVEHDYYGSLFEEYGIQRGGYNEGFEAYKEELDAEETLELDDLCKRIDWNRVEYILFLEKLFFGTPFISKPKFKTASEEMSYIVSKFDQLCEKTFGKMLDMKQWFQTALDYFLYETDFGTLVDYYFQKNAIDFNIEDVVAYRTAKHIEEIVDKNNRTIPHKYIMAAKDMLMARAL